MRISRRISRLVRLSVAAAAVAAGVIALPACKPNLGSPTSLVVGPRILAVRGTPAEAAPTKMVTFDALAVEPSGTIMDPGLTWGMCSTPKPPAEANAVSPDCVDTNITPDSAGPTPTFMTMIPNTACMLFGPQTPPVKPGQPPIRPRDADVTGGFYQPVRVSLAAPDGNDTTFELQRITCPLANAPIDVTLMFNKTYTANLNPVIGQATLDPDGAATALYQAGATPQPATATVAPGAKVTLEVSWPDGTAEPYPVWDIANHTLTMHNESLRVSWFASDGAFDLDTSGRGENETTIDFTRNDWTAPTTPPDGGVVHFWLVLRDSRGGIDFAVFDLTISS
jgi:hypothetical protein